MMSSNNMMSRQYQGPADMGSVPVHLTAFAAVKQSRKRLRFQPTITVQPIDCRMTEEEKSRSHYSKNELNTFSLEAKAIHTLSKELQNSSPTSGAHATTQDCLVGLDGDPALRGLELHLCPIRVRNKALARKALLRYHTKLNANTKKTHEEKLQSLAGASAKLSQWSKLVARETARLDSLKAYEGDYLIPINDPVYILPFPATNKRRRVTFDEDGQPAKRRRSH